jgi:hypothetical protein
MPGPTPSPSFDLSYVQTSIAGQALPIVVAIYTPGAENPYTILPNARCLRIDYREGPEPPLARFQYLMGNLLQSALGWPAQFEQLWPIDAQGSYVVQVDDRLVVLAADPSGNPVVLFDGFAQIPQVDISAQSQSVTFVALGVAVRLWDTPISGRVERNADHATETDGSEDVTIDAPCRFNPSDSSVGAQGGYIGNAVGDDYQSKLEDGTPYPVFIDPLVLERDDDESDYWSVGDALKYLMTVIPNPVDDNGDEYVQFPTLSTIDLIVDAYSILDDGVLDDEDVTADPLRIRDYDATNKAVPEVFGELLRYAGIVLNFVTGTDDDGNPLTELQLLRRDALASTAPKPLFLDADGATTLDLARNNATALHLARDTNGLVNSWTVESQLKQIEVTVYLAPLFQPAAGDDSAANLPKWSSSNLTTASGDQRRMYRWFGADECADGHWNLQDGTWVTNKAIDLSGVFPPDDEGNVTYCHRYRPGSRTVIATDENGKPLKAVLEILKGFSSEDPRLRETDEQDGGGWVTVPKGWKLLDDRLGIEVTATEPNDWQPGAGPQLAGAATVPRIKTVTWTSAPSGNETFSLRLTTVIEADHVLEAKAPKRIASPTQFTRSKRADGRDHFQRCEIHPSSINYANELGNGTDNVIMRDDTDAAKAHAEQLRSGHEFPVLAGSATIPFITDYYQIGDRVKIVQGRNASLQINVGSSAGESPTYPWVTAFSWVLEHDRQKTTLQLSDRRAEPQGV